MSCPTLSIRKHPTTGDELGFPRSNRGREQRNRDSRLSSNLRHSRQRRRHELCSLLGWLDHHGFPPPTALSENGLIPKGRLAAIDVAALEIDGGTSPGGAAFVAVGVSAAVAHGTGRTVGGQNPAVDQTVLAPIRKKFFVATTSLP